MIELKYSRVFTQYPRIGTNTDINFYNISYLFTKIFIYIQTNVHTNTYTLHANA